MWVVKRATSLFNSFCSNVAKQVARFCRPFYRTLDAYMSSPRQYYKSQNSSHDVALNHAQSNIGLHFSFGQGEGGIKASEYIKRARGREKKGNLPSFLASLSHYYSPFPFRIKPLPRKLYLMHYHNSMLYSASWCEQKKSIFLFGWSLIMLLDMQVSGSKQLHIIILNYQGDCLTSDFYRSSQD